MPFCLSSRYKKSVGREAPERVWGINTVCVNNVLLQEVDYKMDGLGILRAGSIGDRHSRMGHPGNGQSRPPVFPPIHIVVELPPVTLVSRAQRSRAFYNSCIARLGVAVT